MRLFRLSICLLAAVTVSCGDGSGTFVVETTERAEWVPESPAGLLPVIIAEAPEAATTKGPAKRSAARSELDRHKKVRHYDLVGASTAEVTPAEFERLRKTYGEDRVQRQRIYYPDLSNSLPLIGNPDFFTSADSSVFSGTGQIIAVADTPIGNFTSGRFGNCLGGPGTGTCRISEVSYECGDGDSANDLVDGHGPNVTGIASSVASQAQVLFFDIFSPSSNSGSNLTSDGAIICALNKVAERRLAGAPIVSVNLSLGGGTSGFLTACSTAAVATAIRTLTDTHKVMVAVASGNGAQDNSISMPGCVPWATTVGAVYDETQPAPITYSVCTDESPDIDAITCFTNLHGELDILAPGMPITAAGITMGGTSQATPHVAGAAARLASFLGFGYSPRRASAYLRRNGIEISPPGSRTPWDTVSFPRLELMLDSANNPVTISRSRSLLDDTGLIGLDIPDAGSPVTDTITIPTGACIGSPASVTVDLDILHPVRGEITATLSRGSTTIELTSGISGTDTRFGIHELFTSSSFSSESCSGNWTLSIQDDVSGNAGVLTEWTLMITDSGTPGNVAGTVTSAPSSVPQGGDIDVNFDKNVSAPVVPSTTALYLRRFAAPGAPLIRAGSDSDSATSAGTHNLSISGTAPNASGVYELFVRLDDLQDIQEPQGASDNGELDNDLSAPAPLVVTRTGGADFTPFAATLTSSTTLTASMTVTGTWRAANLGNSGATLTVDFCFVGTGVKSGTTVCTGAPVNYGTLTAASVTTSQPFSFTLPGGVDTGSWLFEVRTAANPTGDDIDASNNLFQLPVVVGYSMPDLVAERIVAGAQADDLTIPMTLQYRNAGAVPAGPHTIRVVASTDDIIGNGDDQSIGEKEMPSLATSSTQVTQLTIDPSITGLPEGDTLIRLALVVDAANTIAEASETNNSVKTAKLFRQQTIVTTTSTGGCAAGSASGLMPFFMLLGIAALWKRPVRFR